MSGEVTYRRRDDGDGPHGAVFTVHLLAAAHGELDDAMPAGRRAGLSAQRAGSAA